MDLPDIDFSRMRSGRAGGQREGFEDFVCELAAEDPPHPEATFVRLHGAGGDGGVECFWSLPDGTEDGCRRSSGWDRGTFIRRSLTRRSRQR